MWVQEKKAHDVIDFNKVEGKANPVDMMTKYVGPCPFADVSDLVGTSWIQGRAKARDARCGCEENKVLVGCRIRETWPVYMHQCP